MAHLTFANTSSVPNAKCAIFRTTAYNNVPRVGGCEAIHEEYLKFADMSRTGNQVKHFSLPFRCIQPRYINHVNRVFLRVHTFPLPGLVSAYPSNNYKLSVTDCDNWSTQQLQSGFMVWSSPLEYSTWSSNEQKEWAELYWAVHSNIRLANWEARQPV